MSIARKALGRWGEELTVAYLQERGYQILAQNWHSPAGEIDIIARDKETLVFVEVRTRRSTTFGLPSESVNRRKQQKIRQVALGYMQQLDVRAPAFRFDVAAILVQNGMARPELTYIMHAF